MKSRQDFDTEQEWLEYLKVYFAAMAMQGMLACSHREGSSYDYAADAVNFSDALIAELNKEK